MFKKFVLAAIGVLFIAGLCAAAGRITNSGTKLTVKVDPTYVPSTGKPEQFHRHTSKAWVNLQTSDFEANTLAPWTHTNGAAYPHGWGTNTYNFNGATWVCPTAGSYSLWIDDDDAGSGFAMRDTAMAPVVNTTDYTQIIIKWGMAFNDLAAGEQLQFLHRTYATGTWSGWTVDRTWNADVASKWDSLVIDPYSADSLQIAIHYYDGGGWQWYAVFDNITIDGYQTPMALDVKPVSIDTPATAIVPPSVIFHGAWTIKNAGTDPASDFTTHYNIYDSTGALLYGPSGAVTTPETLFPDSTRQFSGIADFTPDSLMWYTVEVITDLAGDLRPENDTLRFSFRTFDELIGNVTDDNNGGAILAGVTVTAAGPETLTTTTDGSGNYSFSEMTAGSYTFTAVLAGYSDEIVTGVTINDNMQNVQNIAMGYPVLAYGPMDSMYVSLDWGTADSTTWDLTLNNTGTRDLHYSVSWPETVLVKGGSKGPVSLIVDDGANEDDIGIGGTSQFIWLNRFTPGATEFPFLLNEVQVYFQTGANMAVGDSFTVVVYENTSANADPAVGSNLLYSYPTTLQTLDAWNVYTLPAPVLLNGPGDVLIGMIALKIPGSAYYPAAIDQTVSQVRSWAGWWSTPVHPEPPALPPDNSWGTIDGFGLPGNWMVRGYGASANAPWLDISPYSGTIGASNSHILDVAFNSAGYDSFTTWGAKVQITSDGAIAKAQYTVPAFMHVLGMTGVEGKPTETASPAVFALLPSFPNPARGRATFNFSLPTASEYSLKIYNLAGQLVHNINGKGVVGQNRVAWNPGRISNGVYFYQLNSAGKTATSKLLMLK